MKVTIDGVEYTPLSELSTNADETAKAILRSFCSGYYGGLSCHKNGGEPNKLCECSGCHLQRLLIQFLGSEPECEEETDPGFITLWKSTEAP